MDKQANHILDLRQRFRDALAGAATAATSNRLTESQQAAVARAVGAYGTENDNNGVVVGFSNQGTGTAAITDGTPLGNTILVNFDPRQKGNDLIIDVAHEGSHVADWQDFNENHGMYDFGGLTDITKYETERRAYEVSAFVAQAVGKGSYPNNLENNPRSRIWDSGWKAADRERRRTAGINRFISEHYFDDSFRWHVGNGQPITPNNPGFTFGELKYRVP